MDSIRSGDSHGAILGETSRGIKLKYISCHACGETWQYEPPMSRRDECPSCRRDSRVCLNCQFFDESSHRQCREPQAEWVKEKQQGNFCGYFATVHLSNAGSASEADRAAAKLSEMFNDPDPAPKPLSLGDLFKGDSPEPSSPASGMDKELEEFLKKR